MTLCPCGDSKDDEDPGSFTGRGGKSSFSCSSVGLNTDKIVILSEVIEIPCLVGPRKETVEAGTANCEY